MKKKPIYNRSMAISANTGFWMQLDREAKEQRMSRSQFVRELFESWLLAKSDGQRLRDLTRARPEEAKPKQIKKDSLPAKREVSPTTNNPEDML
jgi:hypothetical protein